MINSKFDETELRPFVGIKIPKERIDIALNSDKRTHKINNLFSQMNNGNRSRVTNTNSQKTEDINLGAQKRASTAVKILSPDQKEKVASHSVERKFPLPRIQNKTMTIKELIDDRRALNFNNQISLYESVLFHEKLARNSRRVRTTPLINVIKKEKEQKKDCDIGMDTVLINEINKEYQEFETKVIKLLNFINRGKKKEKKKSQKVLRSKHSGTYPLYMRNSFEVATPRKLKNHKYYQDLFTKSLTSEKVNNCTANTPRIFNSTFSTCSKAVSQSSPNSFLRTTIYKSVDQLQENLENLQATLNRERLNTEEGLHNEINTHQLMRPEIRDIHEAIKDDKQAFIISKCKGQYTKLNLTDDYTILKSNDKEGDSLIKTVNVETVFKLRGLLQKGDYRIVSKVEPLQEKIAKMKKQFKKNEKVRLKGLNHLKNNSFRMLQLSTRFKS